MKFEDANGDRALAAVAQRSDDRGVGASAHSDVLPATGFAVTSSGGTGPVQEAFDNPRGIVTVTGVGGRGGDE